MGKGTAAPSAGTSTATPPVHVEKCLGMFIISGKHTFHALALLLGLLKHSK